MSEWKNAEQYCDPTAGQVQMNYDIQPGEVYQTTNGKVALIVKRHNNSLFSVLLLTDKQNETQVKVGGKAMYTNPEMLCWQYRSGIESYIDSIDEKDMLAILKRLAEIWGIEQPAAKKEKEPKDDENLKRLTKVRAESEKLKAQLEVVTNMYNTLLGKILEVRA